MAIHDPAGRVIRTLRATSAPDEAWQMRWDGTDDAGRAAPGGIYWARVLLAGRTITQRVVKIR